MRIVKKENGFTLIEIIVSMILIPLVWFAVYVPLSVNTMLISQAKHRAQAVFIAQQNLDTMRASGFANLAAFPTPQNVTIDTRGTPVVGDDLIGVRTIILGPDTPVAGGHYRQVTVTVNWPENTVGPLIKPMAESLITIISDDPAG